MKALLYRCKEIDLSPPILSAILTSNQIQKMTAFDMIRKTEKRKIAVLGLSFKSGTDDLRESPSVELIEMLIGKGFDVNIYDKEVSISRLIGSNRRFIKKTIPHISKLLKSSLEDAVNPSEVVVITKNSKEFVENIENPVGDDKIVIDLIGIENRKKNYSEYEGTSW